LWNRHVIRVRTRASTTRILPSNIFFQTANHAWLLTSCIATKKDREELQRSTLILHYSKIVNNARRALSLSWSLWRL
jgi:hypothetical protein